jgi:hypothetical protein
VLAEIGQSEVPPHIVNPGADDGMALYRGGNPYTADMSTIQVFKERSIPGRSAFAIGFMTNHGPWQGIYGAVQRPDGTWIADGGAYGGGGRVAGRDLWVNLAGSWGSDGFVAGGDVYDSASVVKNVILRDQRGQTYQDTTDSGEVLFLGREELAMPCSVELCNQLGEVLAVHDLGH